MRFPILLMAILFAFACSLPPGAQARNVRATRRVAAILPDRVEVTPPVVRLDGVRAVRQLVVTGYFHGEPRDLTTTALYRVGDPRIANQRGGRLAARKDGNTRLTVVAGGRTLQVPVSVVNARNSEPVSFLFEALPVLTKQGCASGSCHGSPHGKGGFSLSLYGYDPAIDRVSLTRDGFNRRINVMEPTDSLMIKKPLLEIPHGGGKRLHRTDAAYGILRNWIFEGAPTSLPAVQCEQIVVSPGESRVLRAANMKQQVSVLALFSDRSTHDVTPIATYTTSNAAVATARRTTGPAPPRYASRGFRHRRAPRASRRRRARSIGPPTGGSRRRSRSTSAHRP